MPIQVVKSSYLTLNGDIIAPPTTADQVEVEKENKKLDTVLSEIHTKITNVDIKIGNVMPLGGGKFLGAVSGTAVTGTLGHFRNIKFKNADNTDYTGNVSELICVFK